MHCLWTIIYKHSCTSTLYMLQVLTWLVLAALCLVLSALKMESHFSPPVFLISSSCVVTLVLSSNSLRAREEAEEGGGRGRETGREGEQGKERGVIEAGSLQLYMYFEICYVSIS